jgi:hypothetical protein
MNDKQDSTPNPPSKETTGAFKLPVDSTTKAQGNSSSALGRFSKLKLSFEGGPCLEEFVNEFEVHSASYGWSDRDQYVCLNLALRGQAYQVLSDLPADLKPEQGYPLLLRALTERFGETPAGI